MASDEIEYMCSDCGSPVRAQDKVCTNCGAGLEEDDASSSQAPQPGVVTASDRAVALPPFESAASLVKLVTVFSMIYIALQIVGLFSILAQIELLSAVRQGQTITMEAARANDFRQLVISVLQMLAYVPTALLFLMWFHRAYKNLAALGATDLEFSPGWAVGGFFVPVLNLVRPFQVATEIWKASDASTAAGSAWRSSPPSPIIGQWWGGLLAGGAIGWFSLGYFWYAKGAPTIDLLVNVSWAFFVSGVASAIAALLTIRMVKAINSRQESRKMSLTLGPQSS